MPLSCVSLSACLLAGVGLAAAAGERKAFSILDYGAKGDGNTPCAGAIGKAIDACAAAGGGTVRIPAGTFRTGAVRLRSGVTLRLEKGATLLGSRDRKDYYLPPLDANGRATAGEPVFCNLIHGEGLRDVGIVGEGTIDGSGSAFRDKTQKRPKCIYLAGCRNVLIEGVRMRAAGSWMQHYRLCEKLTIRDVDVFNHVSFNNDGMNVDSCRDVTIARCRVDSDDDGIVLKSLSSTPCRNVAIRECTVSSHCNGLKMGTESGGGFVDVTIEKCTVFSPKHSQKIYGRQRGLAGLAMEIVDGGRLDNVRVSDVDITGVSVPIFLRLGNRARVYGKGGDAAHAKKPGVGTFRKVRLSNITATGVSAIGCSITGLPGHRVEDVVLENVKLRFEGGGSADDAKRDIPEREASYPESTMFGTLPAWGLFCRHVRGLRFANLQLRTTEKDLRHAIVLDDAAGVEIDGLDAGFSPGAAALLRLTNAQVVTLSRYSPKQPVDTLFRLEGKATRDIRLTKSDLTGVRRLVDASPDVPAAILKKETDAGSP